VKVLVVISKKLLLLSELNKKEKHMPEYIENT